MATYESFEDLEVWQLAMDLCTEVYLITNFEAFSKDFGLKDQIRRCSVSVPSNIAEGFERDSKNQFIYFLTIAKGSCGELKTQLMIAKNMNYIDEKTYMQLAEKSTLTGKQLGGFIKYLKQFNGRK
jgi:four helix bundle protein